MSDLSALTQLRQATSCRFGYFVGNLFVCCSIESSELIVSRWGSVGQRSFDLVPALAELCVRKLLAPQGLFATDWSKESLSGTRAKS